MGAEELGGGPHSKECLLSLQGWGDVAFVGGRKPDRRSFSPKRVVPVALWGSSCAGQWGLPSTQLVLPCLRGLGGCRVPEPITWWLEMVQLPVFFGVTLMAGMLPGGSPRPGSPWLIRRAGILV